MKTLVVVNGESYWQDYFVEYKVIQVKIQNSEWILKEDRLYIIDENEVIVPDKILWRVGAIKPENKHRIILEMIKLAEIPCVNSAEVLLQGFDRLSMLQILKKCKFPVIPFQVVTHPAHLKNIELPFPFVVKAGNYHGGFGKVLVENEEKWQEVKDLLFITQEYITLEPYINYERDIRYLAIGNNIRAMARKGKYWKANVQTTDFTLIDTEPELENQIRKLQEYIQADILAVDILEEKNGTLHFVEYNDIPGLSGFPEVVRYELAEIVINKK